METHGFVDWRGDPIEKERHGGAKSAYFIYFMVVAMNLAYVPTMMTLVTYLQNTMHMGIASSSTMATNFIGATCAFALFGAFISDSYITRLKTILIFGPLDFMGYGLLALQAHVPSLHPPDCNTSGQWTNCEEVHGSNLVLLYMAIFTVVLGEGCLRACLPSLGGDQFDSDDPVEAQQKSSFFNWYTASISVGAFAGLILIVWIENVKGWDYAFGISALVLLVGYVGQASGLSFYRNQIPDGSPLTRMLQVFVAAYRNRNLNVPESPEELRQLEAKEDMAGMEVLAHTKDFKFLDKASIEQGDTGPWLSCGITQVEETKIVLRMLPIFFSSVLSHIALPLLLTFTVQQGSTMDTQVGKIHISPASLMIIPVTFQTVFLVVYDRFFVPFARRITGYARGITHLQRVGIGFVASTLATLVAAVIERKRKSIAEDHGLQDANTGVPMSVLWLIVQFFLVGVTDATTFAALLEFFNSEASRGMKSIGTAIFWCILGLSSLIGSSLVHVVNKATRHGGEGRGWLEGDNLNKSHLDRFYLFLSALGLVAFFNYLFWARRYVYRHNPRINSS